MFVTAKGLRCLTERSELIALARELRVRPDWHEPDEQGLTAEVFGSSFDNAGFWPSSEQAGSCALEQHVILYRATEPGDDLGKREPVAAVNLATLLAWASEPHRHAAPAVPTRKWDI